MCAGACYSCPLCHSHIQPLYSYTKPPPLLRFLLSAFPLCTAAADDVPKAYLEGAFPQVPRATWYQNQYLMVPQGSERATAPWESEYMVIPRVCFIVPV